MVEEIIIDDSDSDESPAPSTSKKNASNVAPRPPAKHQNPWDELESDASQSRTQPAATTTTAKGASTSVNASAGPSGTSTIDADKGKVKASLSSSPKLKRSVLASGPEGGKGKGKEKENSGEQPETLILDDTTDEGGEEEDDEGHDSDIQILPSSKSNKGASSSAPTQNRRLSTASTKATEEITLLSSDEDDDDNLPTVAQLRKKSFSKPRSSISSAPGGSGPGASSTSNGRSSRSPMPPQSTEMRKSKSKEFNMDKAKQAIKDADDRKKEMLKRMEEENAAKEKRRREEVERLRKLEEENRAKREEELKRLQKEEQEAKEARAKELAQKAKEKEEENKRIVEAARRDAKARKDAELRQEEQRRAALEELEAKRREKLEKQEAEEKERKDRERKIWEEEREALERERKAARQSSMDDEDDEEIDELQDSQPNTDGDDELLEKETGAARAEAVVAETADAVSSDEGMVIDEDETLRHDSYEPPDNGNPPPPSPPHPPSNAGPSDSPSTPSIAATELGRPSNELHAPVRPQLPVPPSPLPPGDDQSREVSPEDFAPRFSASEKGKGKGPAQDPSPTPSEYQLVVVPTVGKSTSFDRNAPTNVALAQSLKDALATIRQNETKLVPEAISRNNSSPLDQSSADVTTNSPSPGHSSAIKSSELDPTSTKSSASHSLAIPPSNSAPSSKSPSPAPPPPSTSSPPPVILRARKTTQPKPKPARNIGRKSLGGWVPSRRIAYPRVVPRSDEDSDDETPPPPKPKRTRSPAGKTDDELVVKRSKTLAALDEGDLEDEAPLILDHPRIVEATATLNQVFVPNELGADSAIKQHLDLQVRSRGRFASQSSSDSRSMSRASSTSSKILTDGDEDEPSTLTLDPVHPRASIRLKSSKAIVPIDINVPGVGGGEAREVLKLKTNLISGRVVDVGGKVEMSPENQEKAKDELAKRTLEEFIAEESRYSRRDRKITGPELPDECDTGLQDQINNSASIYKRINGRDRHNPQDRDIFELMIYEETAAETYPTNRPTIRIVPALNGKPPYSPPFEFVWTNRVLYRRDLVPEQAAGCKCEGNCGDPDNFKRCACRKRQELACRTRKGGEKRTGHKGFAYDEGGVLNAPIMDNHESIWECNSECGCGPECINRVVGASRGISVDLYWTGICGWGVRVPPESDTIKKGTFLGLYSGELLSSEETDDRDDYYSIVGRTYVYEVDNWTIKEDLNPPKVPTKSKKGKGAKSTSVSTSVQSGKNGAKITTKDAVGDQEEDNGAVIEGKFSLDAFHYGNWTRFCNHVCDQPAAAARSVYVDEGNLRRPLYVFFALRDIEPGEEITISYFSSEDPSLDDLGVTLSKFHAAARRTRENVAKEHKCFCAKSLCRGTMFADVKGVDPLFEPREE